MGRNLFLRAIGYGRLYKYIEKETPEIGRLLFGITLYFSRYSLNLVIFMLYSENLIRDSLYISF